jgi:protoporphyrinogen/coproporphyrinogen III oxidase
MNSIAVIGGGITGLTAAFQLQRQNLPVTVYEAGARAGGVIQSIREQGYLAEFGPNTLLETSPKIGDLIKDLGLVERRLYSDPRAENRYLVRGRKPVPLPGSAGAFLSTPLFSTGAKLRLLWEPFVRRSQAGREESVAQFVKRRIGQEFLDYAINPMIAGVYAGDPARLSVQHAFPKLHALEQRYGSLILGQILGARERKRRAEVSKQSAKKVSFDEGLQVLTDTLRTSLGAAVRLRCPVTAIRQDATGWTVTTRGPGGDEQLEHSAVVYTGPAYRLPEIQLKTERPINCAPLTQVQYPPVASVVLGFRRADVTHPLDGFGMLIPEVEKFHILGALFSSSLYPNRAPEGHVTLTSYIGGTRAPDLAFRSTEELVELTTQDLRVLLGVSGKPTYQHCFLFPKAIPQYEVGYGRFKELMNSMESKAPGLFLAGNYRDGISLSDSIVSGCNVAGRVVAHVQQDRAREVCQVA